MLSLTSPLDLTYTVHPRLGADILTREEFDFHLLERPKAFHPPADPGDGDGDGAGTNGAATPSFHDPLEGVDPSELLLSHRVQRMVDALSTSEHWAMLQKSRFAQS
jgi:hypothetical protein